MFLVWVNDRQYYWRDTLVEALDAKATFGGEIYEPLAQSAAKNACIRTDFIRLAEAQHKRLHYPGMESCSHETCKRAVAAKREDEALAAEAEAKP